jgi:small-conductance mechanosensitive channel
MDNERIITAATVAGIVVVLWLVKVIVVRRIPGRWRDLTSQLVSVVILTVVVVGALVVADPDQASQLLDSVFGSVPRVIIALIVVIVARAIGRVAGLLTETALSAISPSLAGRVRLLVSAVILGIGVIIALQQVGISTDIILILVAALAFGAALALALAVGLGSVGIAGHVAAGRHVVNRYDPGETIRIGDIQGRIESIGLASTRVVVADGRRVDVPNREFLEATVEVHAVRSQE